jgi:superfamily II DNA or RNA helicase
MQVASVVINYDIDWTPLTVQRAGRILRFYPEPRTVQLYTFVPVLTNQTNYKLALLASSNGGRTS